MSRRNRNRRAPHRTPAAKALPPSLIQANQTTTPKTTTFNELLNRFAPAAPPPFGRMLPMQRDSTDLVPFGPLNPLVPETISPARRDTGRPEPRIHQYEPGWNIPGVDRRPVPWDVLLNAADQVDILRRCIEVRKRHVRSLKWCWNVSSEAVAAAYRADPRRGSDDIEAELRDRYWPDIARLTDFWTKPWRTRGLNLGQWANALQEQQVVLDAVAIYPRMTYGGDLFGLELLDGSTIKPLIDWRGDRPAPPMPAFQQELYGFPRGEYTATTEIDEDGNEILHGGYGADQLYYWQEVYRPRHMFGYSAVEQALFSARLYLKRQGWMLSEYDDGSTPLTWLVPGDGSTELDPRQRTEWERAINDDLSGQTAARNRIKLSYPGFKPEQMASVDERYKPDYDLYLIKLVAAHIGVPIAELGFTESKGLGSSGYHEGQEDVMDRVGRRPDIAILEEIINDVAHRWMRAPAEVQFQFLGLESEDEAAQDQIAQNRVASARMTLNEDRKRQGLPLYDFPEADMPMLQTQRGIVFLEGSSALTPPGELVTPVQAPPQTAAPEGADADPDDDSEPQQGGAAQKPTAAKPAAPKRGPAKPDVKPAPGAAAQKAADPTKAVSESVSTRQRVHDQLAEDYPEGSMAWLKSAVWSGPESVPTSDIDFSNEEDWRASSEPEKVDKFAGKISAGRLKPIILVNTPDSRQYIIIDGHHRALAYRKLGVPAMAYIGRVAKKTGPWDQMHASQRTGDSGTAPAPAAKAGALSDAAAAELAAYRTWKRRHPNAARPFEFRHREAEAAAKAGGGAGPKVPSSARTWPGWVRDRETAAHYAKRLTATLPAAVDPQSIAQQWRQARAFKAAGTRSAADALTWLLELGVSETVSAVLVKVLGDLYAEGMALGGRSAASLVAAAAVDWGAWTPGDPQAAKLVLGDDGLGAGLQQLLDEAGVTVKSMGGNRIDALAQALADALANGDSLDTLAQALRGVLADPSWADMVATTELNRAVSAATLAQYQAAGLGGKQWLSADDGRVCAYCQDNEDQGAIGLDDAFASGDAAPPGHPRCRCALAPADLTPSLALAGATTGAADA